MLSYSTTGRVIVGTVDNISTCSAGRDAMRGATRATHETQERPQSGAVLTQNSMSHAVDNNVDECTATFREIRIGKMDIAQILGIHESGALVFIDESSWVCSVDLSEQNGTGLLAKRHFFLPQTCFAGGKQIVCSITRKAILLARHDQIAMVGNYKEFDYT